MSGGILNNDAIAALVDAAQRGDLPAEESPKARARSRVRKVDFTRPAKFSSDHERRLGRVLDTFCRTASTRLAAELRMQVELEFISTSQLTWANAHAALPENAICATVSAAPYGTQVLLGAELGLLLAGIERLLGGSCEEFPADRKLTEIDAVVAQLFFNRLLHQLTVVFNDAAAQLEFALESVDSRLDSEQLAGVSEPTLAATIEVRHDGRASTLALLIPYAAFAPMADAFSAPVGKGAGESADAEVVEAAMNDVDVVIHAEVAALEVAIEDVLAIRPGDTIRLGGPASAGIALTVGDVAVARGVPGRVGVHRAIQVLP